MGSGVRVVKTGLYNHYSKSKTCVQAKAESYRAVSEHDEGQGVENGLILAHRHSGTKPNL